MAKRLYDPRRKGWRAGRWRMLRWSSGDWLAVLKNLASMSALNLVKAGVQAGVSTLMALYVLPGEYGLITFSLPIIQFIALFTDMGMASAIIRQPALTREEAGGAMSFSVAVAAVAAAVLAAAAGPIDRWTGLAGLAPMLMGLAGAVFCSIVAGVPRAVMERMLLYRRVAMLEGAATVAATLVCLASVASGAGVWALVWFHVALQAVRAAGFVIAARHGIAVNLRWRPVGALLSFGGWVLATNIVNFFGRNAQNILIGAWLGAAAVGLYGLAYQVMIVPLMTLAWPASGVLMATLSRVQARGVAAYRRPVLAIATVTALIALPAMVYATFGLAWPIRAWLSPHWGGLASLLAVLAPLGAIQSLAAYNGAVLIARGYARLHFMVNAVSSAALLTGFVAALPFGLTAVVATYLGVGTLVALGQIAAKLWAAEVAIGAYLSAVAPAAGATAAGLGAAALVGLAPVDRAAWAVTTLAYGGGVSIVLLLTRASIGAAVRDLLRAEQDAAGVALAAADEESMHAVGGNAPPTVV